MKDAGESELRIDLGYGAPPIARLVPIVRDRLSDIPEPESLPPADERFRLLDAVAQFLVALSGTVAGCRHCWTTCTGPTKARWGCSASIARETSDAPVLVVGAFRDTDVDDRHPHHPHPQGGEARDELADDADRRAERERGR